MTPSLVEEPIPTLLEEALLTLCVSKYHEDHSVLRHLLRRTAQFLDQEVGAYAQAIFNRLFQIGDLKTAVEWLSVIGKMEEVQSTDTLPQWHQLLDLAAERRDEHLIGICWKRLERDTMGPIPDTASILISALFRSSTPTSYPTYETMKHVIMLMRNSRLPYDPSLAKLIMNGYDKIGHDDLGARVEQLYISALRKPRGILTDQQMHDKLSSAAQTGSKANVTRLLEQFLQSGMHPTDDTLIAVMGDDFSPSNLKRWRKQVKYRGGARVCTRVMEHLLKRGGMGPSRAKDIVAFYQAELRGGVQPSGDMLHVAIQSLISPGLANPPEDAIDAALKLYRDYTSHYDMKASQTVQQVPGHQTGVSDAPSSDLIHPIPLNPPAQQTYALLLRTLTSGRDTTKRMADVVSLVEDMQRYSVPVDRRLMTSIIILLMDASPTPPEAFRMYRLVAAPAQRKKGFKLDEDSFAAILHAFCTLKTWPHGIPSARSYFEIVADMRKERVPITSKVYTIIIGQLAQLATAAAAETTDDGDDTARKTIASTLARVHNQLAVNTEFTPDPPLWNQLMDAYQRAGCFAEAVRVWQKLFASGTFNHASVSIILDACAFNQAYDVAVRIYTTLMDIEYPMNLRNWNTFLECLCRLDKLDEAMKVLCLEMTGRKDGVEPNIESVRILLKFAAKKNQEMEVRSRVKRFLPKLYFSLPEELRLG